jgi:hypothetical protein
MGACCAAVANMIYVGFDLKPPYGTSAIAYENGTLVGVVKIEATPKYRGKMHRLSSEASTHAAYVQKA